MHKYTLLQNTRRRRSDEPPAPPPPPPFIFRLKAVEVTWTNYTLLKREFIGDYDSFQIFENQS